MFTNRSLASRGISSPLATSAAAAAVWRHEPELPFTLAHSRARLHSKKCYGRGFFLDEIRSVLIFGVYGRCERPLAPCATSCDIVNNSLVSVPLIELHMPTLKFILTSRVCLCFTALKVRICEWKTFLTGLTIGRCSIRRSGRAIYT